MIRVKALNSNDDSWGEMWLDQFSASYIQNVGGKGDYKDHLIVGFPLREFIVHKDNLNDLFSVG